MRMRTWVIEDLAFFPERDISATVEHFVSVSAKSVYRACAESAILLSLRSNFWIHSRLSNPDFLKDSNNLAIIWRFRVFFFIAQIESPPYFHFRSTWRRFYFQLTRVHSALELFAWCALQIYLLTYKLLKIVQFLAHPSLHVHGQPR